MNRFKTAFAAFTVLIAISSGAYALSLQEGRIQGKLGEQADGYVKALSGDAASLAQQVNDGRRAEYAKISSQNGQSLDVVGKLAAGQIQQSLPSGAMYQALDGSWKKK